MNWITSPEIWIAFVTLWGLEIVLGIDNIIIISILAGSLPVHQRAKARTIGLAMAMVSRVLLLLTVSWMARLTAPLFHLPFGGQGISTAISGKDLILILGGLFLIAKSTHEIHAKIEGEHTQSPSRAILVSFSMVLVQIVLLDIVFSLDSVITAVGMVNNIPIMVAAVVGAVIFMMFFSGIISVVVDRHPTLKVLALSFVLLIGFTLVAEGFGQNIPKAYLYFAMGFSVVVECLNIRARKAAERHRTSRQQ